jgi:pimeloyl-ACP methyl ester carboxylesterase
MAERKETCLNFGPGRRVHCVDMGEGPAVVFFPGNGCSVEDMEPLMGRIAERYRFVGIDPPGRVPTEWPDESFSFLNDLPQVVDRALAEMKVGEHVALGHSMGGMLALQHANRHRRQVRGLALLEGFVTLKIHYANVAPNGLRPIRMAPAIEKAFLQRQAANQYWIESHPKFKESFWASQQAHDARPWVAALNIPILVFIGDNGQEFPPDLDAWRKALGMDGVKDLKVVTVPHAGHWMMLDDPKALGDALMPFLQCVS